MPTDAPGWLARELGPGGLEFRTVSTPGRVQARAESEDDQGPRLVGYGSVFDQPVTIEGWWSSWDEEVAPGAWTRTIAEDDIRSCFNHDVNVLLGRNTVGSLALSEDDYGLAYTVDINEADPQAMGVHARVARGDVDGSSVFFRVDRQEITSPNKDNGLERAKRRILEGTLYETGPVVFPAFPQATVTARGANVVERVLAAAGVAQERRARLAHELLSDPDRVEVELRAMLSRRPELRDAVCNCPTPPTVAAARLALRARRAAALSAMTGLSVRNDR